MSAYSDALHGCHANIDAQGNALSHDLRERFSDQTLCSLYKVMTLIRAFDYKAVALQRTGQLGTYPSCLGQEAFSAGIGHALEETDVFVPYYRDQATQYMRGVPLHQLLQLWGGDERANLFGERAHEDLPICVPIATQITHAAGVASAIKARKQHRAVLATCGEGATSRGDFYESLNLAGVWQLPLVVVVNNNQWAISVPRALQTASLTIADKAQAVGIRHKRVDGNDASAVYEACQQALKLARQGKGATLIESVCYRLCDHTTADDASRYRDLEELKEAWEYEPISRLRNYLISEGLWHENKEIVLQKENERLIQSEVETYLNLPEQDASEIIDFVFETLPYPMRDQREQIIAKVNAMRGGSHA